MQATAEFQVIPLGGGVSVRAQVQRVVEMLGTAGLKVEPHASGTNVEGELEAILEAAQTIHETLHAEGAVRLVTLLKLETRTDKAPSLAGKRL